MKLRPYQQQAVRAVIQYFKKEKAPAVLVLPTGAGKSVVIAELARLARGRVLVLTHVAELVEQNAHKYRHWRDDGSIFSAGLKQKDLQGKVVFASIQSVAPNLDRFGDDFSLVMIDECHRIGAAEESQYRQVLKALPGALVLGLTATPYRLDQGWLYNFHARGMVRTTAERLFKHCVFELPLRQLIDEGYLTPVRVLPAPAIRYDFSLLPPGAGEAALDRALAGQGKLTPAIVQHLQAVAESRQGVMIFAASRRHGREVAALLPPEQTGLVLGDTAGAERAAIIDRFKARELKYLVNVSVLTTGFDASHVDLIAILRPTESVSLFQQIVGRGLRLSDGKEECLVLDYAGNGFDLFAPEVGEPRPPGTVPVVVPCPLCGHQNPFWGRVDGDGDIIEHFGRRCQGMTGPQSQCDYRYRSRICGDCGAEADIAARQCPQCQATLVDVDKKLREAMKGAKLHLFKVAAMTLADGGDALEVSYFDEAAQCQKEKLPYGGTRLKRFLAELNRAPGARFLPADNTLVQHEGLLRRPDFLILKRHKRGFWQVGERICDYEGRFQKAEHAGLA
ncbi:DEAD/DEAH box helicase [Gallaecimonas sp. GXIMD4217]|uniref:DEAD/DEAH box helicase n=1 Tax=Gallaecimonas sp. GXIMD4217 TaxID=3131927 RepID=UPI00311AFE1D